MDEFKNLPKNKKILLHFAGFTVFIYRRGKGGDYFGKHEMEKNFKTSVRNQCDCHGGTAMVLI